MNIMTGEFFKILIACSFAVLFFEAAGVQPIVVAGIDLSFLLPLAVASVGAAYYGDEEEDEDGEEDENESTDAADNEETESSGSVSLSELRANEAGVGGPIPKTDALPQSEIALRAAAAQQTAQQIEPQVLQQAAAAQAGNDEEWGEEPIIPSSFPMEEVPEEPSWEDERVNGDDSDWVTYSTP